MKKYLEINNVYKSYETGGIEKTVLEKIDFSIKRNELVVLLGPSGCGKTTLLKIIAGFLEADKGAVYKNGELLTGAGPDRVMVFQEFRQLFPWKTVLANVIFGLKENKSKKNTALSTALREEIAYYYLEKVGLSDVCDYYPHQLSGGMKQRVALARAFAADPEIMLMDEPFGSLDSQTRSLLQGLLLDIWKEARKTILFVTHDIEEAIILADRILVMDKEAGKIKKDIYNSLERPRNRTTLEFAQFYESILS